MYRAWAACLLLFLTACTNAIAVDYPGARSTPQRIEPTLPSLRGRKLIFHDEFEQGKINSDVWNTAYRWGRSNPPELQFYAADALDMKKGFLRIKAEKRWVEDHPYTSGIIASWDKFTFTYGYVEMRAKLPAGQGIWPAFWMHLNDDDKVGEIDIFELLGYQPDVVHMSLHFPGADGESLDESYEYKGPDFSQDYHTFAVDWRPESVTWYIDGVQRSQISHDVPSEPMYLLANLAVGGEWGGYPDSTTRFPAYYDIDYIRVYQWLKSPVK